VMKQFNYIKDRPGFSQLKEPRGRKNFYSDEEIESLITASESLGGEIQDVILFASKTGARRGEIESLKWSEVDFTKGELTFLDTKNGDDRVLPLVGSLLDLMETLHRDRVSEDVFTLDGPQMLYYLRKAQKLAGVDETKCFHTLRHSTASNLWKKGANLVQVMSVLGHRNAATSIRYSHADMDEKGKALALL
jgi:integrase